jgi:predicted RNA-binding Zn ribbon-like protein
MTDHAAAKKSAPNDLGLVIDFVNTLDVESGRDRLSTPRELAEWLAGRGLLGSACELKRTEVSSALRLREALRTAMLAHNGAARVQSVERELESVARRGSLEVHFPAHDAARIAPRAEGFAGALAALLVPVAHAIADGSWQRAKACRAPDCQWAFYDRSRNRSGTWCEMAVCGNRTKVRAYRARSPQASRRAPADDA